MPIRLPATAPVADRITVECTAHGETWTDDYAWLRADNWQQAMREPDKLPEKIKEYLQAENNYYNEAMAQTASLQTSLVAEMRARIQEEDIAIPDRHGAWLYCYRFNEGSEHPVYFRSPVEDSAAEQILLDVNQEAFNKEYFDHDLVEHSPDHKLLAWSCDTSGAEYYRVQLRDLKTGIDSEYTLEDVDTLAWANGTTLFYARVDENHRANRIYRHTTGSNPASDILVYEERDNRFSCGVETSMSGDYIFITTGMNDQDEVWYIPANSPQDTPVLIEQRTDRLEYSVDHQGDYFIILTNADNADDFKVMRTPVSKPSRVHWQDLIEYQQGRMIHTVEVFRDWLMWLESENALPRICFTDAAGKTNSIKFDEEAYSLGLDTGLEYDADSFRFDYSSPSTPEQTWEYEMQTGARRLLKEQKIPSGHDPQQYITRRIMATSHDGAIVPVTLLHHRDTAIDGTAPCLLYGYGSYGSSIPAYFSGNRLSLVDRGFVYAIAHVRGGQEKGRAWYEAAKFENKPNTFHDFIACAEALIKQSFTAPKKIVIHGGSAGGLLVGAVLNMKPEILGGAIADVPFVDVLNTILDDSLPLTPGEWSQWGNPIESHQAFDDIRSYSPYDNIATADYPPILVTAGVSDPRVTYWEPAKWVAQLRARKTDSNVLLLKTNMVSGHYGKTGRFSGLEDSARSFAFAITVVTD